MKAIWQLLWVYWFGAAWLRWFSVAGLALLAFGVLSVICMPGRVAGDVWAFVGFGALFVGSALMPLIFGTLARSPQIHLLPFGRAKLFTSAIVMIAAISLPLPIVSVLALINNIPERMLRMGFYAGGTLQDFLSSTFFWQMYVVTLGACTWLYLALWFATSSRSAAGLMRSLLVLIAIVFLPPTYVRISPELSIIVPLSMTLASWIMIAMLVLFAPQLRKLASLPHAAAAIPSTRYRAGQELDFFFGTRWPWQLAIAQIIPVLLATRFIQTTSTWLFYLTIFSTVSGAIAGNAAARSRSIWLHTRLSRQELFAQAERRFARHNACTVGALMLLLAAIAHYSQLAMALIAWGAPLLVLGTLLSTYLGLMMTRGLQWRDVPLAVGVMLALMATALLIAREPTPALEVAGLEIALAITVVICRAVARNRWTQLDWAQCRVNRGTTAAPSF